LKTLRRKQIIGQYFEAFPNHAAELDRRLDESLATRWKALAIKLGVNVADLPQADGGATRGDWIRAAYRSATIKQPSNPIN
jgi:hypothetical protein